jgi:hypothetical protein
MVNKLIDSKIPVRGLTVIFLTGLCVGWSIFIWAYLNATLMFQSPHDRHLFVLGILCFVTAMAMLFLTAIIGVWFFIFHDAGRRGMNQWLWTIIAIFTPNLLGIIIYLILRKPLLLPCSGCGARLESQLLFCPYCGRQFRQKCSACGAIVEQGHQFCGSCGADLTAPHNANA